MLKSSATQCVICQRIHLGKLWLPCIPELKYYAQGICPDCRAKEFPGEVWKFQRTPEEEIAFQEAIDTKAREIMGL